MLEEVSWPKPLEDLLVPAFASYKKGNPWVADQELSPKSVVRDMIERAQTFSEFVSRYQLDRTEGVLLRYLADAYRTLRQTVAAEHRTEEVEELVEWLGEVVHGTDSSLLDEWERLANPVDDDADTLTGDVALGDRVNMVYKGTAVAQGTGRAVVTGVGMGTEMGRIAELMEATEQDPTPLQREVTGLGRT